MRRGNVFVRRNEFLSVNRAIYLVMTSTLMEENIFLRSASYLKDQKYSVDVDSAFDLEVYECLLRDTDEL